MLVNDTLKIPDGWKLVRLGENIKFIKGKNPPYFSEYKENDNDIYLTPDYLREKNCKVLFCSKKYGVHVKDDIIVLMDGSNSGEIFWAKDGILSSTMAKISFEHPEDKKFLYYLLKNIENIFKSNTKGSGVPHFEKKVLENFYHIIPERIPEQQKIAEILETVDNCIEKTQQLIEKYKRIKLGLMEELLTKGIDENGNIRTEETHRFKNSPLGRIPEEWEVVRLGEVFNIQAAGDVNKLNYSYFKDDKYKYPIYSNSLDNKGLYGYSDSYKYPENCITITGRGTLGIAVPRFEKFNAIIRIIILIPKTSLDITFVTEYINKKVNFVIESTGVPQLTAPKVYHYELPLPPLSEQHRIAEILSQIDEVIEKEEKYKEKFERLKKGLMEDLLSGKIRVNHLI